jgi:hypothetical protein
MSLRNLNRRLDHVSAFIDCVSDRAESNMPAVRPPDPNRLLRRECVRKQIEENLFSPNLVELYESVPQSYAGAVFVRQLLEAETPEEIQTQRKESQRLFAVDSGGFRSSAGQSP